MNFSVIAVGDVQNVLSAMQKNFECPICLELMKWPVSTKCDHTFCRFCMFKLLSNKKQGVTQCPLCKTEVTKRSLKENATFKQLIEGLLETIHAFELDTGVKLLNSHHFPKTSIEATIAEVPCKESSVIQSKGFRNRKRSAKDNGQENCTLVILYLLLLLWAAGVRRCPLRKKTQKSDSEKRVYIEFGSDSSEELFRQTSKARLEGKEVLHVSSREKLGELESSEKGKQYSCGAQKDKLGSRGAILPSVRGQRDFSADALNKKSISEHPTPGQVNVTQCSSSPLDILAVDLLTEQSDRLGDASPLRSRDTSSFKSPEVADAEQSLSNSKSKDFDLKYSSESNLDKSKEVDTVEAVMYEPESDSFPEKELPAEKLPKPETPQSAAANQVSENKLKRSILKVNEWFSKSTEVLSSSPSQDGSAGEREVCLSDQDSSVSEKTGSVVESTVVDRRWSKQKDDSIKDKIFGKTYKRERKSNPPVIPRDFLPAAEPTGVAAGQCLNNSSNNRLKRKRKSSRALQPEDFIKKRDGEEANGCSEDVNWCLGDAEKRRCAESSAVNERREDNKPEEEGSMGKKAAGKRGAELELSNCDQKCSRKKSSAERPCKEPKPVGSEQRQVRRSGRLRLLPKEEVKGAVVKGARASDGAHEGASFGGQRNVIIHRPECKALCEPRDALSYQLLPDEQGRDKEADETQVSQKNSPGKSLFHPTSLNCSFSCSSSAPDAASQEGEVAGGLVLQPPSVTVAPTPSHPTGEVAESPLTLPQRSRQLTPDVLEDLGTEESPAAQEVSDLTREAEDSELDTQYLRDIFRHSKRLSFSLHPVVEGATAGALKVPGADQVGNKQSKCLATENPQEKAAAESLSRVCGKDKSCESACVSPEGTSTGQKALGTLFMSAATSEDKSKPQGSRERVSSETPAKGDGSPGGQSATEQHGLCFSPKSHQMGKTQLVGVKGPALDLQSGAVTSPATGEQRAAEFRCEVTGSKEREGEQLKGSEEQAAASTGLPECLVTEAPEGQLKGGGDLTGLSETPDGLLGSDEDTEHTASISETDKRERSAVFIKTSDNTPVQELPSKNMSPKPRAQGSRRTRRRARKLQSSDEESSEDEELPSFHTLLFGKSASTPLQSDKQVAPAEEASVSPVVLPPNGSRDGISPQKAPEVAQSNRSLSPSQESERSVNLFSSQSNLSEESADGAEELRKGLMPVQTSKQARAGKESEGASQSCHGELKISDLHLRDVCQGDPNVGAQLGEASGSDSEASIVEDSCEPFSEGEILTTQQKNMMQNNLKKLQQEMAALEAALKQHGSQDCDLPPLPAELPPSSAEGPLGTEQMRQEGENTKEQRSGTRLKSESVLSNLSGNVTRSPNNSSSSSEGLLNPQTAEATNTPSARRSCTQQHKSERSSCLPVAASAAGEETAADAAARERKVMSIVASGLNQREHLVVQKFARRSRSILSNHITEGTTHVIMKTDQELVCERTLKYFLGIAGRKWVVSYQWVVQSLEEGRILDEENFEVRGDVINGRNHQGPKRARQCLTEKIFKGFEVCCCGPYTDMTTEHLESMVELCGAHVVKHLHLFTHRTGSTAVVVVQPDAWMENVDRRAIQQKHNVAMVTREWVLDSVACYQCQELDSYLV
ncbi:BRCA1 protein, partial [Rhinopomastus cyanomelas]|nr:BRCA1 protein [Rhinopomastus cyanomelas]